MKTDEAIAEVAQIVAKLLEEDSPDVASDQEPSFLRVLEIASEPHLADVVRTMFVEMLTGVREAPEWLIPFCMRRLQWDDIRRISSDVSISPNSRLSTLASEVLEAYGPSWDGDQMFDTFRLPAAAPRK
jgi:hypothetical protein